ncbi:MAG: HD domain-containing protein [Chloroflexi bacterium]|nr:HD domain-containing protein [Chloroflexota bacterium]
MTNRAVSLTPAVRALLAAAGDLLAGTPGYLVGGSLRDALRGRPLRDLDLAVAGDAPALARGLAGRLRGHFVLLDKQRDIARVVLDEGAVRTIDIAPLRGEIEADLGERDFTVDALAVPIEGFGEAAIIDPHGGLRDLDRRAVRLVSERALVDDPLRLLRAVRLATQLDFKVTPETADAIRRHAGRISEAAPERQRDEIARCLATPRAGQSLRLMDDLGLLERLFPEVTAGRGVEQPKEHYWDVFDHAIEAVAALDFMLAEHEPGESREAQFWLALWQALAVQPDLREQLAEEVSEGRSRATLLKLAALLHDVAKPETRAPDATGRIRFFGHAERGAETARLVLRRFRFSRREIDLVATMVEEHLRPTQLGQGGPPSRRALYRFYRDTGDAAESVLLLSLADHLAARGPRLHIEDWQHHASYIAHVLGRRNEEEAIARPVRIVTGNEVMVALGIDPGPEVGRLLAALEEAQASGEIADREEALAFARKLHGKNGAEPALIGAGGAV